jgi:hypothetical protein
MTRTRTRTLITLVATGGLLALAGPAHAAIVASGVDEFTETNGPLPCEGFTLTETVDGRVEYMLKQRGRPGDYFWSGHGEIDRRYTNDETGRSWTAHEAFYEHDTRVLSRDGDLLEMLVTSAYRFDVFDEGGELDSSNRGMSQWTLLIDTQGTLDPSDDTADYSDFVRNHGASQVGDFCEDAARFTTD